MPTKPKRPCSALGCPKLTHKRFCNAHAKKESQRYEHYDRDPAKRTRYGWSWRRIRGRQLATHPLCEQCRKIDKITPAREVHHIKPLSKGGSNDPDNLMSLCTSCHSTITARDGSRWGKK